MIAILYYYADGAHHPRFFTYRPKRLSEPNFGDN